MMDTDELEDLNAQIETVAVEHHENGVAELRLDRSRRMNAINEQMIKDLTTVVERLSIDPPDALVVTGSGHRAFSIGLDPDIFDKLFEDEVEQMYLRRILGQGLPGAMNGLDRMEAPVISAVQGPAYGGGLEVALATDIRIAGESTEVAMPEIHHGFLPAAGATQRLPASIGETRAKEIMFTGDMYDAETLSDWGLFKSVVSDDEVEEKAFELADSLASNPRSSYAGIKHTVRAHSNRRRTGLEMEFMYASEQSDEVEFSEIK